MPKVSNIAPNRVPDWMQPTPEQKKEIENRNARLRHEYELSDYSDSDKQLLLFAEREEALSKGILESSMLGKTYLAGEQYVTEVKRLIEALITQGKFDEALKWAGVMTPDEIISIHTLKYAMNRDDNDFCDCSDNSISDGTNQKVVSRHFRQMRIYSPKHEKMMSVMVCSKCLHTNITDARTDSYQSLKQYRKASEPGTFRQEK